MFIGNGNGTIDNEFDSLQERIGYRFLDIDLLKRALTHKSFIRKDKILNPSSHYERLEFLGDSVLGLVISEYLFNNFPNLREGPMTKIKSFIVSRDQLGIIGRRLKIDKIMFVSNDERKRTKKYNTVLSNSVEALIGAMYIDGGIEKARVFILKFFKDLFDGLDMEDLILEDYKSIVQEIVQKEKQVLPEYKVIKEKGPEHNKTFTVQLSINGDVISRGSGASKKRAEQKAAQKAYKIITGRWQTLRKMRRYFHRFKKEDS